MRGLLWRFWFLSLHRGPSRAYGGAVTWRGLNFGGKVGLLAALAMLGSVGAILAIPVMAVLSTLFQG